MVRDRGGCGLFCSTILVNLKLLLLVLRQDAGFPGIYPYCCTTETEIGTNWHARLEALHSRFSLSSLPRQ
jgi:hypothetical protein